MLRVAQQSDRAGLVELLTCDVVRRQLGGALTEADAVAATSGPYGGESGSFVAADATTDEFLGTVGFDRRDAERPGHLVPTANELELSYAFLPRHWGKGYATEAATLALDW
jgi:RimJ/RimL family protein N-acetyltransferase